MEDTIDTLHFLRLLCYEVKPHLIEKRRRVLLKIELQVLKITVYKKAYKNIFKNYVRSENE